MPRGGRRSTSFKPGVSGNRAVGRDDPDTIAARQALVTVRTAARALTQEAIDALAAVIRDGSGFAGGTNFRGGCTLDRGHGRPTQAVELNVGCDLGRLTDDELDALEQIMERAALPPPIRS